MAINSQIARQIFLFEEVLMERMKHSFKRVLSMLLVMLMVFGLFPFYGTEAYADNTAMTFTFKGSTYTVTKGGSGSGTGVSWSCDANGNFTIKFTQSGTFQITKGTVESGSKATVLGGGGGGDSAYSGGGGDGGGAGELKSGQSLDLPSKQNITITVGAGGAGGSGAGNGWVRSYNQKYGSDGGSSSIATSAKTITANGGSGGGGGSGASGTGRGSAGGTREGGGGGSVNVFHETDWGNINHYSGSCFICGSNWGSNAYGQEASPSYYLFGGAESPGNVSGGAGGSNGGGKGGSPENEHGHGPKDGASASANTGAGGGGGAWGTGIYQLSTAPCSGSGSREYNGYAGSGGNGGSGYVQIAGKAKNTGYAKVTKEGTNTTLTSGNSCYSLAGAQFGVYASEANAKSNSGSLGTLTTDANGNSGTLELTVGTYWIREITAPPGYALDTTPKSVTIEEEKTSTVKFTDNPTSDPVPLILKKVDSAINQAGKTSGMMSLEGAEYTFKFYGGLYDNASAAESSGKLLKTWVFKTDSDGYIDFKASYKVSGDAFYTTRDGIVTLPLGTLVIQETKAPTGFVINNEKYVVKITEDGADKEVVETYNVPTAKENAIKNKLMINKVDRDLYTLKVVEVTPQGDAELKNAQFDIINRSKLNNSGKTVRVDGKDYAEGSVVKTITTSADGIAQILEDLLPYGDYEIVESKAPAGYTKSEQVVPFSVRKNSDTIKIENFQETVIRGGLSVTKVSAETGVAKGQGGATLKGAVIQIINRSANAVVVNNKSYAPGKAVMNITTDANGVATTGAGVLPYGTYELKEISAPEGYSVNSTWSQTVQIRANKVYTTDKDGNALKVEDQVWRGNIQFLKVHGITMERMQNVAFKVTNVETGESHIAVTDVNGQFDSAMYAHSSKTNANDAAYSGGKVNESKLDPSAGIWFSGGNTAVAPKDSTGAFPFGKYRFEELRSSANKYVNLVTFDVVVYRDKQVVDAGTIDDQPIPHVRTLLLDNDTQQHMSVASTNVKLIDQVTYAYLLEGEKYEIRGRLLDQTTGQPIKANGKEITATTGEFKASAADGVVNLTYNLNASQLAGKTVYSEVSLIYEGYVIFIEDDLKNEDQTLWFPKIGTKAQGPNGEKEFAAGPNTVIIDTVSYENLVPDVTYVMKSELIDKVTGKPARDASGAAVTAETTFKPTKSSGTVDVRFEFDSSKLGGGTLVAFERLTRNDVVVASHEDINDIAQTVTFPKISTTLIDNKGNHILLGKGSVVLTDKVAYEGLTSGVTYTMTGTLMDKETGAPIAGSNGKPITGSAQFTPGASGAGTVEIKFTINASDLQGMTLVAFEEVTTGGKVVAGHKDITDEDQTVYIPSVRTTAAAKNGDKEILAQGTVEIVDVVEYTNLKVGEQYTISGTLMNKATNKAITVDGKQITDSKTFVAQTADGSVSLLFRVNAAALEGTTAVAFEELTWNNVIVGEHKDMEDEDQTVRFPKISTMAQNEIGGNEILAGENSNIIDRVTYSNVTKDTIYTLSGTLMDKETGRVVRDANGDEVKASIDFTPSSESGTVDLHFTGVDLSNLENKTLVVYEQLFNRTNMVARHEDINDASQTIYVPKIRTTLLSEEGTHAAPSIKSVTIKDTVTYENLKPGKTYTMTGTLMEKATGFQAKDANGQPITSTAKFTPTTASGSVVLEFTFDATRFAGTSLVAFEQLSNEYGVIGHHEDLEDEEQSIYVPKIGTNAYSGLDGEKEILAAKKTVIIDTVAYESLVVGQEYVLTGTLMDKSTGEVIKGADGVALAGSTVTTKFIPTAKDGSINLQFTIDASTIDGTTLVAFEELYCAGKLVAEHTDLDDEAQTVYIPKIRTTASSEEGSKEFLADGTIKIVDKVMYENLTPGKTYTVKGTLMVKDNKGGHALKDRNGDVIVAEATFIPTERNGFENVVFEFDASELSLKNKSLVAYENLYNEVSMISLHEDIEDEDQTVRLPEIRTTLHTQSGTHLIPTQDTITVIDTVVYKNLKVGKTYTMEGVLMNKLTGIEVVDENGNPIKAHKEFVADSVDGSVDIEFTFNSLALEGTTLVAFEDLSNEYGIIATHKDIDDEEQTGYIPKIRTTFEDKNGNKEFLAEGTVTIIDTVAYEHLKINETYTMTGVLVDKDSGETLKDTDGNDITVSKTFTVKKDEDGTVDITFRLSNAVNLEGHTLVAYEKLFYKGEEITNHEDINDEGQTVTFPKIRTNAHDENGAKEFLAGEDISIIDTVKYYNLIPGKTYTMTGKLMDKNTGKQVKDAATDSYVEASVDFTPDSPNGEVDVVFTFDASNLKNKKLVAFETLENDVGIVGKHNDITDEDQTVDIPEIRTNLKDEDGDDITLVLEDLHLIDTITYKNLIVGNEYTVSGKLMDKITGEEVVDSEGNPITASTTFTAESVDGSVEVEFVFDATLVSGHVVVAFEQLSNEFGVIAVHEDLEDKEQTVYLPEIKTTASASDGAKDIYAGNKTIIKDVVSYKNLKVDTTYIFKGVLMDKDTNEPLLDENGNEISASTTLKIRKSEVTKAEEGTVTLTFQFDASELAGHSLVAFERVMIGEKVIAIHEDIEDEDQTVEVPSIRTEATDEFGAHATNIGTQTMITDRVDYTNLIPGESYVMYGVLMNKANGNALKDFNGDKIEATMEFIPEESEGYVELTFMLDTTKLEDNALVAFERLTHQERLVADHQDIEDEDQSVHFPTIRTTARLDGNQTEVVGLDVETVKIIDTVSFNNLVPDITYKVTGTLMNKRDGSPLRDEEGEAYVSELEFTPASANGSVDVVFEVPSSIIDGQTVVVFESLMLNTNTIAFHRDIDDVAQTVTVPYLNRGFKYDATNNSGLAGAVFKIVDKGLSNSAELVDLLDEQVVISDEEGYFYYATLPGHQYSLIELEAPEGYIRDSAEFIVDVDEYGNMTGDVEIANVHGGTVVIRKTDVVTGDPLADCEITVWKVVVDEEATAAKIAKAKKDKKDVSKVEPVTKRIEVFKQFTDKKGRIYFYTDDFGTFVFKETNSCDGFYLNTDEYTFTINEDLTVTGETRLTNVPYGTVVVKKTDKDGKPLAGAQLAFYDEYDRYLGQGISDAKGRVYFVSPGPGKYYFTEVKAPDGYQVVTDHYHFQIANDYTITGTLTLVNGRPGESDTIDTGDSQNIGLWIGVAGGSIALAAVAAFLILKKKKEDDKKDQNP